ncbi:hypothetical protein NW765_013561 [Fusarium oxysporum]|nr:hypothetical protein NW765_013561 [Fusarium oxysporum]
MPESTPQTADSGTPKAGAPKDKNCPFCGQAFTSSSLGRHLDLYIKEKNPNPRMEFTMSMLSESFVVASPDDSPGVPLAGGVKPQLQWERPGHMS